jgi:hypothetical protein
MSRLIRFGRFGEVYVAWYAGDARDGKAPLLFWHTGRSWQFVWKALDVIVSPPRGATRWEIV